MPIRNIAFIVNGSVTVHRSVTTEVTKQAVGPSVAHPMNSLVIMRGAFPLVSVVMAWTTVTMEAMRGVVLLQLQLQLFPPRQLSRPGQLLPLVGQPMRPRHHPRVKQAIFSVAAAQLVLPRTKFVTGMLTAQMEKTKKTAVDVKATTDTVCSNVTTLSLGTIVHAMRVTNLWMIRRAVKISMNVKSPENVARSVATPRAASNALALRDTSWILTAENAVPVNLVLL